jgi:Rrf2 family protein
MLLSTGCQYAVAALVRIVHIAEPGRFCLVKDIVGPLDVPQDYLRKLLQQLVRGGVLASAKGRGGGFALKRLAGQITLRHIAEALDGPGRAYRCLYGSDQCGAAHPCDRLPRWAAVRRQLDDLLDRTTLADLAAAVRY